MKKTQPHAEDARTMRTATRRAAELVDAIHRREQTAFDAVLTAAANDRTPGAAAALVAVLAGQFARAQVLLLGEQDAAACASLSLHELDAQDNTDSGNGRPA